MSARSSVESGAEVDRAEHALGDAAPNRAFVPETTLAPGEFQPDFVRATAAFAIYEPVAGEVERGPDFPSIEALSALLARREVKNARGEQLRCVLDAPKPKRRRRPRSAIDPRELYDGRIHERAELPTRARSWHDLFGALQWASFPRSKALLNARQWAALQRWIPPGATALPSARLREQDALAMLDEGGLVLLATTACLEQSRAAASRVDLEMLSSLVRGGGLYAAVFGHALSEHLVLGRQTARGMPVVLHAGDALPSGPVELCARIDAALAARLADPGFCAEPGSAPAVEVSGALFAPR